MGAIKFNLGFQKIINNDGKLSSEIQLFKTGLFEHWSGAEFLCDEEFMDAMIKNFKAFQKEAKDPDHTVPIDYNHGSLSYGVEECKAAGWITQLTKKEDGLYATVNWTKKAEELIKAEEFRFISPEFDENPKDEYGERIEGPVLYAAALTNRPFLKGMDPVTLNKRRSQKKEELNMRKPLIKLYALAEDADELAIVEAAKNDRANIDEIEKTLECKAGKAKESIVALKEAMDTIKANLSKTTEEFDKFKTEVANKEAEQKVNDAIKCGKVLPKHKDKWLKLAHSNVEMFDELVNDLPPVVDLGSNGSSESNSEEETLHDLAVKLSASDKISYKDAYHRVAAERPELAKAHRDITRPN